MEDIIELGTDINSNWNLTSDGDLELISGEANLVQATRNRLNNILDSFDDYYYQYGSVLSRFLGWKRRDITLKFMRIELEACLKQDPRYNDFTIDLEYADKGSIQISIDVNFDDDTELNLEYLLGADGTVIEV